MSELTCYQHDAPGRIGSVHLADRHHDRIGCQCAG